ncbi:hypothetical protein ACFO1B_43960 [Dactylosporangium siamense]|uniref:Uncharacterized protein n=1 Tax=Dactylosporangium siamense TaxID=685454 RepID=A0A919Q016_9ACTN|nr:hypothetical protein [Dactylosporangium siamense]GIG53204.1 hypothetical protein Dsi01nite_112450 [Dactylosporangium siamense]
MTSIERVTVLHGHTDQDSAYLVGDYPYGRILRCQIRYWIETAPKGAKRGMQRFVSQTTDPRKPGTVWNKPHPDTYDRLTIMYLNSDDHVKHTGVSEYGVTPEGDAWLRLRGILDQLTDEQRRLYDALLAVSRRSAATWEAFEATVAAITAHIADTGAEPEVTDGTWIDASGRRRYLGEHQVPMYLALADQRLNG